jgi:hypothetical protein
MRTSVVPQWFGLQLTEKKEAFASFFLGNNHRFIADTRNDGAIDDICDGNGHLCRIDCNIGNDAVCLS